MITRVSRVALADGTSASSIASPAQTHTTGNLLVANIGCATGATVSTVTDLAGNTWHKKISLDANGADLEQWYAYNVTGATNNIVTATFSGAIGTRSIVVKEWHGTFGAGDPSDQSSTGSATSTSLATGTIALAGSDDVIDAFAVDGGANFTGGTGYTLTQFGLFWADEDHLVSAPEAATATLDASHAWVIIAGAYTESPPALISGTASVSDETNTAITVTSTAATGGSAPITYQWQRSTSPISGFADLAGKTSLTCVDSTAVAGVDYSYRLHSTDATPTTVTSNVVAARLTHAPVRIMFIGHSIVNGYNVATKPGTTCALVLSKLYGLRDVTAVNQGVNGAVILDWATGAGNTTTALAAAASANFVTGDYVGIMCGTNDAANHLAAATWGTRLDDTISWIHANGFKAVLFFDPWMQAGGVVNYDDTANSFLLQYQAQMRSRVNGINVFMGDDDTYTYFARHPEELQGDGVHDNDPGSVSIGTRWAGGMSKILNPSAGGGGSGGGGGLLLALGME